MRTSGPDLSQFLSLIYEAALDSRYWDEVLRLLLEDLRAAQASLNYHDFAQNRHVVLSAYPAIEAKTAHDYLSYYGALSPVAEPLKRKGTGWLGPGEALLAEAAMRRTEYYNDFLRPLGIHHMQALQVLNQGDALATLTFWRPEQDGAMHEEPEVAELLRTLAPHMLRSLAISQRLQSAGDRSASLEAVLDGRTEAILLVDGDSRILYANAEANSLFSRGDGLMSRQGTMTSAWPYEAARLAELVRMSTVAVDGRNAGSGGSMAVRRRVGPPLQVTVAPLVVKTISLYMRTCAVVFVSDGSLGQQSSAVRIARLFQLTPAESRLAGLVGAGVSLRDAASQLGINYGTARSRLKAIFAKTGVRRQAELVRLSADFGERRS